MASLLSDFLTALGVPHTEEYTDASFASMPFKSLFGFSRQLKAYGVDSVGVRWSDKSALTSIPVPFLAQLQDAFVIVNGIAADGTVSYRCAHKGNTSLPAADFERKWTGVALLAYPSDSSCEPGLSKHRFTEFTDIAKKWILIACAVIMLTAAIISSGIYDSVAAVCLLLVDVGGLGVTWLLLLKSLKVSSRSADRICGILQDHGCDTVLEQKASTFFGIFSWSEVGFSYFTVSTLVLLIFPSAAGWLALVNLCCLPFSFWSIWYQKCRIHSWCTLCVITQALLWLQAGCYLWVGAWHNVFPLNVNFITLLAAYGASLMACNRIMNFIKRRSGALSAISR